MDWVYLSPHLDDVALSCGGLLWEQAQEGQQTSVWTICAGDPPAVPFSPFAESLHIRWQTGRQAVAQRRSEDLAACRHLLSAWRHFSIPDCIYRRAPDLEAERLGLEPGEALYASEEDLFGPLHPAESGLLQALRFDLEQTLPEHSAVVCPLALGGHVDHRLVRAAAQALPHPIWYYADYPYALQVACQLDELCQAGWSSSVFHVSEEGMQAWERAGAEYASQISTFWPSVDTMRVALRAYALQTGGGRYAVRLWRPPGA